MTSTTIPKSHLDILDKRPVAHLGTVDADGSPQVTPVWFAYRDGAFLINTARGRKKDRNLTARPWAALSICDPDNPYRYIGVKGRVVEATEVGAHEFINELSHMYGGQDFVYPAGQQRVTYRIVPVQVWTEGG